MRCMAQSQPRRIPPPPDPAVPENASSSSADDYLRLVSLAASAMNSSTAGATSADTSAVNGSVPSLA